MSSSFHAPIEIERWDKRAARWAIDSGMLRIAEEIGRRRQNVLRILAYHRIGTPDHASEASDPSLFSASTEAFAEQMNYLAEHYRVLSLEELLEAHLAKRSLPARSVLITFDDGYRDFRSLAWPVLKELKLPVVLFVATGYVDGLGRDFWWDVLYRHIFDPTTRVVRLLDGTSLSIENDAQRRTALAASKAMIERHGLDGVEGIPWSSPIERTAPSERPVVDWHELRTLESEGVYVAPHTRTHPVLSRLPLAQAADEVEQSRTAIEAQLSRSWPIFAYPHGHARHIPAGFESVLERAGFRFAVTLIEGHNIHGRSHPFRLKRVSIAPHLSLPEFRLTLTGAYDVYGFAKRFASGASR